MTFDEEQILAVEATEPKICVKACAGSGKTRVITGRIRYLLNNKIDPNEIVAITFTNAAAINMRERVGEGGSLVHISTVHSFVNYILKSNNIDTSYIIENEQFNELFELFKKSNCTLPKVKHLIVDEAQDCTQEHYDFFDMLNPENIMLVADARQEIYAWNGAVPELFLEKCLDPFFSVYCLNNNYRCSRSVLRYAQHIIRAAGRQYHDNSRAMRDIEGKVFEVPCNYKNIGTTITLGKYGEPGSWFVLCRTNQQVYEVAAEFKGMNIPYIVIKKSDFTSEELEKALNSNKVKIMTIHQSKGLESPNVCVIGAKFFNLDERCLAYVAATRARDYLVWTTEVGKFRRRSTYLKGETWEQF